MNQPERSYSRTTRKRPARRGRHPVLKAILALVILGLAAAALYGGYSFAQFKQMLAQITDSGLSQHTGGSAKAVRSKPTTILLLGLDSRKQTGSMNTDVIMVASLNPDKKTATLVSIPRDTYMKPAGYSHAEKANAFYSIEYRDDKTHQAYAQQVKKIYGDYLGVPIDYMVVVDFGVFRDTIDALGGVNVTVDKNMCYEDSWDGTSIHLQKGPQVLDGKNALDFVRYRKSNCGNGEPSSDFERNDRQQQVLSAIVDKLKSVGGVARIGSIFQAVGKNVTTDISQSELQQLILTYAGISNEHIEYIPIEGTWKSPYTYLDTDSLNKAKQSLQNQLHPEREAQGEVDGKSNVADGETH